MNKQNLERKITMEHKREKRSLLSFLLLCIVMLQGCTLTACTTIEPGEVGIKVDLVGGSSQKEFGKIDEKTTEILRTQRVFYFPYWTEIYKLPTKAQTYVWTADSREESSTNEEISFDSIEGSTITADISMSLMVDGNKAAHIYNKFHLSVKDVIRTYARSLIRITFNEISQRLNINEIREKKTWIGQEVTRICNEKMNPDGFEFQYINFIGELRYPKLVQSAINDILSAKQDVQKERARESQVTNDNESKKIEAEQNFNQAKNRIDAEANLILSTAQSEAQYYKSMIDIIGADEFKGVLASERLTDAVATGKVKQLNLNTNSPIGYSLR